MRGKLSEVQEGPKPKRPLKVRHFTGEMGQEVIEERFGEEPTKIEHHTRKVGPEGRGKPVVITREPGKETESEP